MRNAVFIFSLVFFLFSCSGSDQMPKGILSKQKMQDVMWDLVQATEYLNAYVLNKDSIPDKTAEAVNWYENVYRLHHTSKTEFDKSYAYYKEHPLLMKEVLDSLAHKKSPVALLKGSGKDSLQAKDSLKKKPLYLPGQSVSSIDSARIRKQILMHGKTGQFPVVDTLRRKRPLRIR